MRLLERTAVGEIRLTGEFVSPPPQYAILSHTWGIDEVSFKDMKDGTGKNKLGYIKIQFCAERARLDGLQYFWVDTCSIDKSSSSELQEAINSMFRWYRDATKCYVYLSDVSTSSVRLDWTSAFRKSRWFTRGWTLQELIAPATVEFFSQEGMLLGNKRSLENCINDVTGIPLDALRGSPLSNFSIPKRMAWINKRNTTREEDKAYSLLGIFDVQIPLLYGEGREKAFKRLLEEIDKVSKREVLPIPIANNAVFDSRAEEYSPRCHPDTRIDLLDQIQAWVNDPHGKCIFWLNGAAGTGKSTISRTVAVRFNERGILGASFFFKRGESDRGNATLFFTTIAAQLVLYEPRMAQLLKASIDSDPTIATSKGLREQFDKLILQPLSHIQHNFHNPCMIAIVVDALDECNSDDDIKRIIYLFSQLKALDSVRLKVFVTSRPEVPIRLGFRDIKDEQQNMTLHQIPEPVIEHDISMYLNYQLSKIRDDYNGEAFHDDQLPSGWPGKPVVQMLAHRAVPLFIFAATICRFIEDPTWHDPAGQLAKVLQDDQMSDSKLDKLDSTYLPALRQLVTEQAGMTRRQRITDFQAVVGPIILLAEPLSASSLSQLLGISTKYIARILKDLHAVLDVPSKVHSLIRPFHLSFRDFLIDPDKRTTNEFWIDRWRTHERLATQCLELLSAGNTIKRDICGVRLPGICRSEIDQTTIDASLPPEVRYACRHWTYHWKESERRIRDGDLVHHFLTQHLLHWLEALGILGRISESIIMINDLLGLLDPEESGNVSEFLHDTRRVILNHRYIIDISPLQVYYSAIVFAPEQSIVRKTFRAQFPGWLSLPPQVDSNWDTCLQTLEGHTSSVNSVAFSHDSKILASASDDETVKLWDVEIGVCTATLKGHSSTVNSVEFSHDSKILVSACYAIKLWDVVTGACIRTLEGAPPGHFVSSIAFSDDSRILASGSSQKIIKLWDVTTGICISIFEGHDNGVKSVVFSHDSKVLASASADGSIKLWNVATGVCTETIKGHGYSVESVTFSHNSKILASGSIDSTTKVWKVTTKGCMETFKTDSIAVYSVKFSHDSKILAWGTIDGTIKLWDVVTGFYVATLKAYGHAVYSVRFSHDSKILATGSDDGGVRIWDTILSANAGTATVEGHSADIKRVTFSHDSRILASSDKRTIKLWDIVTGICTATIEEPAFEIYFSYNSKIIASAPISNDTVNLWDVSTGACTEIPVARKHLSSIIAFSYDSKILAFPSPSHAVVLWDITKKAYIATLEGNGDYITSATFLYNSKVLASASDDGTIKLWDVTTRACTTTLEGHRIGPSSLEFSHDSKMLASAAKTTVKIWDIERGVCTATFEVFNNPTYSLAFSNDSKILVSSAGGYSRENSIVELWDIATGACTARVDVRTSFAHLDFDIPSSSLYTSIGTFKLDSTPLLFPKEIDDRRRMDDWLPVTAAEPPASMAMAVPAPDYLFQIDRWGVGLSEDGAWITWNSHRVLWLPLAYRPEESAVAASTVAIGCRSGRVILIAVSPDLLERSLQGGDM